MSASAPNTEDKVQDATLAVPVWDLPVRLFHWSLAGLIAFSWATAELGKVQWHLWSGFTILFLLLFRVMWGFLGSSTARFSNFVRGPRGVLDYLHRAKDWAGIGHTPLGALSVVALLGLTAAQVAFGLLLSDEDGVITAPLNHLVDFETAELAHSIHEALFNVLVGFIILHVVAILYYRVIRGKRLVGAMVRGTATLPAGTQGMEPARRGRLIVCLLVAGAITAWIIAGVPPFGT